MSKKIQLDIVTPEKIVFSEQVDSFLIRATDGEIGILPDHAPILTSLEPGLLHYAKGDDDNFIAVMGGFLEVKDNKAVVLSDAAEPSGGIEELKARLLAEQVELQKAQKTDDIEYATVEADLQRILLNLRALEIANMTRRKLRNN